MSNAIVIESLDPPVMDVTDCIKCGASCGDDITLSWQVTLAGKPTAVRLHFCTPCAIDYLAAETTRTREIEREIAMRLQWITAAVDTAAIAGPAAGGMQ